MQGICGVSMRNVYTAETEIVPYQPDFDFEFVRSHQELSDEVDRLKAELAELRSQQLRHASVYQINYEPQQSKRYNNWVERIIHEWIPG